MLWNTRSQVNTMDEPNPDTAAAIQRGSSRHYIPMRIVSIPANVSGTLSRNQGEASGDDGS